MVKRRSPPMRLASNFGRFQDGSGVRYTPKPDGDGYTHVRLRSRCTGKSVRVGMHRIVHILFNDPEFADFRCGDTVDHKDGNRSNNNKDNLRWASRRLQRLNQKQRSVTHNPSQRVRISRKETVKEFESLVDAAIWLGVRADTIKRESTSKAGWEIEFIADPDLEGEEWRPTGRRHSMVSSFGRVMTNGCKRFPVPYPCGYCRMHPVPLAHVVLVAFGFPRPSPAHSADHIDRNPSNNSIANLRWASASDQRRNQGKRKHSSRPVEASVVGSKTWVVYDNRKDAAEATGVRLQQVTNCLNKAKRQIQAQSLVGVQYEFRKPPRSEPQSDVSGEEWKPVLISDWLVGGKFAPTSEPEQPSTVPMARPLSPSLCRKPVVTMWRS